MNTVPEHGSSPSEADQLRDLLAAIADVLDIPAGDDYQAALQLTRDRSILVQHAARDAATLPLIPGEADHLRTQVAEYAPDAQAVPGE